MSKNDKLIEAVKALAKRNELENIKKSAIKDTPQIYAAICIALHNNLDIPEEDKLDAINQILADSQQIWLDVLSSGNDILDECEEITGIRLEYKVV